MNRKQIIRAWRDEDYRSELTETERTMLPDHPAGIIDLSDDSLGRVGGYTINWVCGAAGLIIAASAAISCYPVCKESVGQGTCANFSSGCC